jgi:hypothetical protein
MASPNSALDSDIRLTVSTDLFAAGSQNETRKGREERRGRRKGGEKRETKGGRGEANERIAREERTRKGREERRDKGI